MAVFGRMGTASSAVAVINAHHARLIDSVGEVRSGSADGSGEKANGVMTVAPTHALDIHLVRRVLEFGGGEGTQSLQSYLRLWRRLSKGDKQV